MAEAVLRLPVLSHSLGISSTPNTATIHRYEHFPLDYYLSALVEDEVADIALSTHIMVVDSETSIWDILEELSHFTQKASGLAVIELSYNMAAYIALADGVVVGAKLVENGRTFYGEKVLEVLEGMKGPATIILYVLPLQDLLDVLAYPHLSHTYIPTKTVGGVDEELGSTSEPLNGAVNKPVAADAPT